MEGEATGDIIGGATQSGREGAMVVIGYNHEVVSPLDAGSGLPTGKRQHKPLTITKELDRATPLIAQLLTRNENIPRWRLEFYRSGGRREEILAYSITLTDASVSAIRQEMLDNSYAENAPLAEREHISFAYRKIEWTWEVDGATAQDDWEVTP
jgi:type VI secretion system secreted protein Hcp